MGVARPAAAGRGARLSNTWLTCPRDGDNPGKLGLIPDRRGGLEGSLAERDLRGLSPGVRPRMGPRPIMVVGGVMARQADDG
ncbi:MAG: hypothetical protein OSP8Acid_03140 [uncultured Acidilobus sp. OSP8]|jgi:hypothetical protein|nr:MAG: hypothetical protein OSP8Acid_03140 [uncultured Acidilobus sp. OSP8]